MHSIGNEHDAQTILFWVRSHPKEYGRPSCVTRQQAPEGWEYVGRGSFRSVWRSPEGVAYKVGHYEDDYQSSEEVSKLKYAWEQEVPEGCRLPKFSAYYPDNDIVVAVELIEGETLYEYGESSGPFGDYYDLLQDIEDRFRLSDMHDENAIVDRDGYLVPVDFGG
jgi:RIO-like serine/threonine protein kinase